MKHTISGHEDYEILEKGVVVSYKNKNSRILKSSPNTKGYLFVDLDGKPCYIHRLVAIQFIENKNKYTVVNHIDGNKQNNNVNNLEWVTQKMNVEHAHRTGLIAKSIQKKIEKNILLLTEKKIEVVKYEKNGKCYFITSYCHNCKNEFSARADSFKRNSYSGLCKNCWHKKLSNKVVQLDKNRKKINEFISVREAERETGVCRSNIYSCLKGKYKTAGGFIWGT